MNSSPTPPIEASPLRLCGVEWASPQALIASAPSPASKESYVEFYKRLKHWAQPFLVECWQHTGKLPLYDQPRTLHYKYSEAIENHLFKWLPLKPGTHTTMFDSEWNGAVLKNGEVNIPRALNHISKVRHLNELPPPPVLRWILDSLKKFHSRKGSMEDCFGLKSQSASARKTVIQEDDLIGRDLIYAYEMALLTDNGLEVEKAAGLVEARDQMLDDYFTERYGSDLNVCRKLLAEAIIKSWRTDWQHRFKKELDLGYYDNETYLAAKKAGTIKFLASKSADDYFNSPPHFKPGADDIYGNGISFPIVALNEAISQGLRIGIK